MLKTWQRALMGIVGFAGLCLVTLWIFRPAAPPKLPLRIGLNQWPAYEYLHLAQILGLYQEQGVQVELIEFSSLVDARRSYERSQLDGLGTTATDVLMSRHRSPRTLQIAQVIDESFGGDVLLVRKGIKNLEELAGKRLGLENGSVSAHLLARALEKAKLTPSQIRLHSADQLSLGELFRKGEIDAIVSYTPYAHQLERDAGAIRLFDSRSLPGEIIDVLAFDQKVIEARPEDVAAVIRAYRKAQSYAAKHPDWSDSVMAAREQISVAEFRAGLSGEIRLIGAFEQPQFLGDSGILAPKLNQVAAVMRAFGDLKGPDRMQAIVTDRFLGEGL